MNAIRDVETAAAADAILLRILDCCLREDLDGLASRGVPDTAPDQRGDWLRIDHLPDGTLWLPVSAATFLQRWKAREPRWVWRPHGGTPRPERGSASLLNRLAAGRDPETRAAFAAFAVEADTAAAHRLLCRTEARRCLPALDGVLDAADWGERLLGIDRIASHADHPFYPTARAKTGFDADALRSYAPEWGPRFLLRWLAVPRDAVTVMGRMPRCWPDPRSLGLPGDIGDGHVLMPVHPLTWTGLPVGTLPPGTLLAQEAALPVIPTLSVRTVACAADPGVHVKLPLRMRTLGARNLRLVKPDTLHDGHALQRMLQAIAAGDPALRERIVHADESAGGHVGAEPALAFMVRRYPDGIRNETPVPVAALAARMADGTSFAERLISRFHGGDVLDWARTHATLLLDVHLRLWLRYGIALEANQQNAVLLYGRADGPRLLMKDNDAARLDPRQLARARPELGVLADGLRDRRIADADADALAAMVCTITVQLCIAAPFAALARRGAAEGTALFAILRTVLRDVLATLDADGIDTVPARRALLEVDLLPVKYLLTAGSLLPKTHTGAADINKFYGRSAPNFLRDAVGGPW